MALTEQLPAAFCTAYSGESPLGFQEYPHEQMPAPLNNSVNCVD